MRESATDLDELQETLNRSYDSAGSHLRSIFDTEHRLTAEDLVAELDGIFEMHLATVTAAGAPLVAPVDGVLYKGRICFGLPARSVRAQLVRRDPRVSASLARGSFAFIVHGVARELDRTSNEFAGYSTLLHELYVAANGPAWIEWYEQQQRDRVEESEFNGWISPRLMFAKR